MSSARRGEAAAWIRPDRDGEPSAVALVLHGLNLQPRRMDDIAETLARHRVESLRVALRGHRDPDERGAAPPSAGDRLEDFCSATFEIWMDEARAAFAIARSRASACGVPLVLVGFSLGAVVGCSLLADSRASFDGMLLFAPAFRVHWYLRALRVLKPFPRLHLPSQSPPEYRANASTPVAAYTALFDAVSAVAALRGRPQEISALVFADPRDELVSYRGLCALCDASEDRWSLVPIERALRSDRRDYHHLVIDRESLGDELWKTVGRRMRQFIEQLKPLTP